MEIVDANRIYNCAVYEKKIYERISIMKKRRYFQEDKCEVLEFGWVWGFGWFREGDSDRCLELFHKADTSIENSRKERTGKITEKWNERFFIFHAKT